MKNRVFLTTLFLIGIGSSPFVLSPAHAEAKPLKPGRFTCHTITSSLNITGTAAETMQDQNHRDAGGTVRTVKTPGIFLAPAAFGAIILDGKGGYTMPTIRQSGRYGFDKAKGVPTFTGDLGAMKLVEYSENGDRFSLQWDGTNFHCGLPGAATPAAKAPATLAPGQIAPNAEFIRWAGPKVTSAKASEFNGVFDGSYVCGAAPSNLRLKLKAHADGTMTGEFEFGGVRTPEFSYSVGSYSLKGNWSGTHFVLKADRWIKYPQGYTMVDIEGDLTTLGASGKILFSTCDSFAVQRSD